ncbi:TetR/AcrR family transcriptional regulator [Streptomyces sp. NBC_01800]|uniref:TetR/AcrR family transcriptional regulator n=1 Tax=Streptomyces sp. NBC_01800 TaxID=2975945 RepID=UPI002DDBA225|nr:TetR/AcrR family transcriptional regulator [Streptomyces sp. NBC_01800]WSA73172.1 TetR/AcrR family transcriptional regulator [Streptomyces sp. NBC_01800]
MPMSASRRNRYERRRAETRKALVRAARPILAESGDTSASIHAIAERADVGFGSFYNHFTCKPDLFDAAVDDAMEEYAQAIDERLRSLDDPAERLAGGVRLSTRIAESHPEIMRILCHIGLGRICSSRGLAPRAERDVEQGITLGRFTVADPVIAPTALNGSLLALLELGFNKPEVDADQAAGKMAETLLHMLGVSPDEARDVAQRPLPAAA